MKSYQKIPFALIAYFLAFSSNTSSLEAQTHHLEGVTLNVCGDGAEWPPYIYWQRDKNGEKTSKIVGYTVDLLSRVLSEANVTVKFFLPPWKRCLEKSVDNSQYTIALDASYSKEREKTYLLTRDYYHITPKIFYLKKNFPKGLPKFKSAANIFNIGTICGLFGYNYEGFSKGIDNNKINMDAKNFDSLTQMVASNRCKAFIARYEILAGFKNLGED